MRKVVVLLALLSACASGPPSPAALDTRNESCGWCRMTVSDARSAAQIVAPSEEPRFFDDIGCLAHYIQATPTVPKGSVAYVADHRTKAWVRADAALYTLVTSTATPMGSHLIAHASAESRDADADTKGGSARTVTDVFGAKGPPRGEP
jgi:copper chaperone NosL